jgi:serine/threonine protein kinase
MDTTKSVDANEVAQRARELGPRERNDFVQQHCGDDVTLASQVFALLEQNTSGAQHWQGVQEAEGDWQPNSLLGARLGPYQLTKLLGAGGMGEVYLAARVDAEFQQQVAIKLVRNSLLSENIRTRLRTERQILASLQHPNIATLLDGGTAPDGTPYIVMEYIDGTTIDVFCDRENLTVEQRLQLFCKVCAAVQCAHQSLIVHRDLKPSNILVTDEGEPKLLDFGIAKLLDTQLSPRSVVVTHHDIRMMTPAHASPEQIRGEMITTSSDVYVLGVLLYELLCGRRPFKLPTNYRLSDLERVICTVAPLAPSAAITRTERESPGLMHDLAKCRSSTVQKLKSRLQGDLDNIVLMALRKEPARRYVSAEQFANDVQHWLHGHPVIATKDTLRYRSSKFIRRHAVAVGTVSTAAALLAGFSVVTYVQARNIAKQRDAIAIERTRAEQVSSFLVELFQLSDPSQSRGNELKARELLDVGARRIDSSLDAQPATRAMLLGTIGRVYGSLGLNNEAIATLEKALQARLQLYGNDNAEVADALIALGDIRISQGELDEADKLLNRALQIQQRLHGSKGVEQAPALRLLGRLAVERSDTATAERLYLAALSLYDSHGMYALLDKAIVLSDLGELRAYQYRDADAEKLFRAALAAEAPAWGEDHPRVAELRSNLADALEGQGKYSEAQPLFEAALSQKRRVLGSEHPQTIDALENYGSFLRRKGDYAQAQVILNEALQANLKTRGEQHSLVGYDHVNLGLLDYDRGDYAQAETEFRTALDLYAHSLPARHIYVAGAQMSLGRALTQQGKLTAAITMLNSSIDIATEVLGTDSPVTYRARSSLGVALVAKQRYEDARELLMTAKPIIERVDGTQSINRELQAALAKLPPTQLTAQK